jgi:hypothetical protein
MFLLSQSTERYDSLTHKYETLSEPGLSEAAEKRQDIS